MQNVNHIRFRLFLVVLGTAAGWGAVACRIAAGQEAKPADFKAEFLRLCDIACDELNKEISRFVDRNSTDPATHHVPFFEDAYAVRAICVAYDLTGKKEYLDTCKHWADRVIALQGKMIPTGAYYLNYGRQPGANSGDWFVADSGSVAMAVLAVAVRTTDRDDVDRYLGSVESFAKLVIDNYVGAEGGITDGIWSTYDGQWWCSTATFGGLMFLLHERTGDQQYLKIAQAAMDWTIQHDFRKAQHISFEESAPGVVFYVFEQYAIGLRHVEPGSEQRKAAMAQIALAVKWLAKNQKGRGAQSKWDYLSGATYMGGMPYLMYGFARQLPEHRDLASAADTELRYLAELILKREDFSPCRLTDWELLTWTMMSYAEKVSPGKVHRTR